MASENPQDRASLERLTRKLDGISAELERQLVAGREELAAQARDQRAAESARQGAARETTARRRSVGRGRRPGAGPVTVPDEPAILDEAARAADRLATNQQRALNAARERLAITQAEARLLLQMTTGPGGPSGPLRGEMERWRGGPPGPPRPPQPWRVVEDPQLMLNAARERQQIEARTSRLLIEQTSSYERMRRAGENAQWRGTVPPRFRGGGGGGGGDRPPTAAGGAGDFGEIGRQMSGATRAARELSDEEQQLLSRARGVAEGQMNVAGSTERATRAYGLSSTALRKHGALTTEFIEAAAKGQTTFSELGYQVSATIGKFAGWTAAATAVYGALAAVSAMGHGALEAESGVGLLSRTINSSTFNADGLRQSFRDLAGEFNLPIDQVVQSAYGMSKAFNDQKSALTATQSVLYAVKVGELDADTATRALTATINGFHLSASALPGVMDAVNNAQNKLGGNTGQLVLGLAKSSGAAQNAGVNFRELIALLATGTRLTGQTGEQIGTALSRSMSVLQTPAGAARAKAAGLDPTQPYMDVLRQAQQQAKGASGERVQELARALVPSGGAFARIFVPILQNAQQLDKALGVTSAQDARGASARELAKALRQPNEQLSALVTNLQRVGAALAQTGAITPFVGLLVTLNKLLSFVDRIIEQFDRLQSILPAPFDSALVPALELYGVLRLLRRFDVGNSLPVARNSGAYASFREQLKRPEQAAGRSQVLQGLGEERKFLEENRQNTARASALSAYQAERARERVVNLQRIGASEDDVIRAQREFERRVEDSRRLAADEADLRARINTVQQQSNRFQTLTARGYPTNIGRTAAWENDFRRTAQQVGINFYGATSARPGASGPMPLGARTTDATRREYLSQRQEYMGGGFHPRPMPSGGYERGQLPDRIGEPIIMGPATATDDVGKRRAYTSQGALVEGRLAAARAQLRDQMEAWRAQSTSLQQSAREGGVLARSGVAVLGAAGTSVAFGARGVAGLAAGFRAFGSEVLASLGPLDVAVIGITAAFESYSYIKGKLSDSNRRIAALSSDAGGLEGVRQRAQAELGQKSIMDRLQGGFATAFNAVTPGAAAQSPDQGEDALAKRRVAEMDALEKAQGKGRLLYVPQIKAGLRTRLAAAATVGEQEQAINKALDDLRNGWARTFGDKKAKQKADAYKAELLGRLADLRVNQGDLQSVIANINDPAAMASFVGAQQQRVALEGYDPRRTPEAIGAGVARARELIATDPTPENVTKYLQSMQALQGLMDEGEKRFQQQLAGARGVGARGRVRQDYVGQLQARIQAEQARGLQVFAQAAAVGASAGPLGALGGAAPGVTVTAAEAKADPKKAALRAQQIKLVNAWKAIDKQLKLDRDDLKSVQREQDRAQFEEEQGLYDARTTAIVGRHTSKLAGARAQLTRDRTRLGAIADEYGKDSTEYVNAVNKARQDRDAVIEEHSSRLQSDAQLRASRNGGDAVAAAREKLKGINDAIAYLASKSMQQSDAYRTLLQNQIDAQTALVDAQLQSFTTGVELARSEKNIGATDEQKLRGSLADAQRIAAETGRKKGFGSDQYKQAAKGVNDLRAQLADFVRQQAQDAISAHADLLASRTDDPVKQARYQQNAARQLIQFARTPAERDRAVTAYNNSRRNTQQEVYTQRVGNIDFDLEMEKIDRQTAIARYEGLLHSMKLTKEQKRDLQRKIHQLQQETESDATAFDLDVGSIKMPTVYDVRRAFSNIGQVHRDAVRQAGAAAPRTDLHSTVTSLSDPQVDAQVNVYVNDPNAAGQVYTAIERSLKTHVAARVRNAGRSRR